MVQTQKSKFQIIVLITEVQDDVYILSQPERSDTLTRIKNKGLDLF